MIQTFEHITQPLTSDEYKLVNVLVRGFRHRTKENPIKAPEIINSINRDYAKYGLTKKLTEPRLRKLVNYIRSNGILPLIATSSGYYCSINRDEINAQINSMKQRADAIINAANGLERYSANFIQSDLFTN